MNQSTEPEKEQENIENTLLMLANKTNTQTVMADQREEIQRRIMDDLNSSRQQQSRAEGSQNRPISLTTMTGQTSVSFDENSKEGSLLKKFNDALKNLTTTLPETTTQTKNHNLGLQKGEITKSTKRFLITSKHD